ncbi:hypothetical protein JMN32_05025 [Fulvivirga sp. 29W222]|uniref:Uncharacterized protein n=1 Tax=Fulvivirga marina TaxID=2494733 RepID=A0A937FTV2_9BACT|nr:hypothetical protein [Fulvivirga marina]MBL6445659.1 hypothetical protein [Fulvivirga marina]
MNEKIRIKNFWYRVIYFQIFHGASVARAVELAKQELGNPPYKYNRAHAARILNKFDYQSYKRNLLERLSEFEKDITNSIAIIEK